MRKFLLPLLLSLAGFVSAQDLSVFGGYHTHLYGYEDERYIGSDKGDYLKTLAWFSGAELTQRGLPVDEIGSKIELGGAVLLYTQGSFAPKTLYAVASENIDEETVPSLTDRVGQFQLLASAFGGFQDEWWAAEGGLTVFIKGEEEKVRKRYASNGTEVEGKGRGWVFGDGNAILPNLLVRLGSETLPHFVVSMYRGEFDPGVSTIRVYVQLPFNPEFQLQIGGSVIPTSSIYLEPTIGFGDLSLSVRGGTVLNYNNPAFTRVGVFEGAFVSGAVGYHW